jgi:hypothetical protein
MAEGANMTVEEAIASCRQDAITIWEFEKAPDCWQYHDNGGDEDYVAYIPESVVWYGLMLPPEICGRDEYKQPNGLVVIGYHA